METKVIETKLSNVFNSDDKNLGFDVNTPQFLKEACEGSNGGMYAVCYNIFKGLLVLVAERATVGQVETIIKMCEYCRENKIPYRHMLHTILRDWEDVYGMKVDWEKLKGNQSERKDDEDLPF